MTFSSQGSQRHRPPPAGAQPPAQAVSAGYTHPVFMDEFTSDTITSGAGANRLWYTNVAGFGSLTTSVNGSAQANIDTTGSGILTISTASDPYGAGLSSQNGFPATVSTPTVRVTSGSRVFQYGYYECSLYAVRNGYAGTSGNLGNWPAWWLQSQAGHNTPSGDHCEIDILELQPVYSGGPVVGSNGTFTSTLWDWNYTSGVNHINSINPLTNPTPNYGVNVYNTFGCLWTPTLVEFYYNNQRQAATLSASGVTGANPMTTGPGSQFPASSLAGDGCCLLLGTGWNWPMHIDFVHVWQ